MTIIALPKALSEKLGEEASKAFVDILDQAFMKSAEERFETRLSKTESRFEARFAQSEAHFETRFAQSDAHFETRFAQSEARFEKRFVELESRFEVRFATLEARLADSKAEIIKWMFVFWAGQVATSFAFLKLLR